MTTDTTLRQYLAQHAEDEFFRGNFHGTGAEAIRVLPTDLLERPARIAPDYLSPGLLPDGRTSLIVRLAVNRKAKQYRWAIEHLRRPEPHHGTA